MSRIGNAPVVIPSGVDVQIQNAGVTVKGPKGTLSFTIPAQIKVEQKDGTILFSRDTDIRSVRALHGLARSLVNNMVLGVTQGFTKQLEIRGVGYRAKVQGNIWKV